MTTIKSVYSHEFQKSKTLKVLVTEFSNYLSSGKMFEDCRKSLVGHSCVSAVLTSGDGSGRGDGVYNIWVNIKSFDLC